ncbi:Origin recognition complex subunit 2 [Tulasnella sp. 418]|nr:Origin recognition complex subunit 2 [Tulasnella sp. 418]
MKSVEYGGGEELEALPRATRAQLPRYDHDGLEDGDEEAMDEESNSDPEPTDEEDGATDSQDDDEPSSPTKRTPSKTGKAKRKSREHDSVHHVPGFITQTSFDLYFQAISIPSRTSSNTFTSLLPTLTADEYDQLLSETPARQKHKVELDALRISHSEYFSRYLMELRSGFNLLFYGFGSKRRVLNQFAKDCCAKVGDVVVINGFRPSVSIKDVLNQLDQLRLKARGADDDDDVVETLARTTISRTSATAVSALDAQAQRIYHHFKPQTGRASRPVFILIHNIDSLNLRTAKSKSVLGLLASNPRIHLVGSIDHMNAPLIWTESEALGRGHYYPIGDHEEDGDEDMDEDHQRHTDTSLIPSERNFTWLWHDLTTFEHYDVEMEAQGRDLTSIAVSGSGKIKGGLATAGGANNTAAGPAGTAGPLTEAGAQQVLSSVTDRSKKLFVLLANKQLASIEAETSGAGGPNVTAAQMAKHAIPYDQLFGAARESFIATSDPALRGLLQEFKDHGMVTMSAAAGGGGGEVIWIPLARNVLERLLEGAEAQT